jgi:hypothetical protein
VGHNNLLGLCGLASGVMRSIAPGCYLCDLNMEPYDDKSLNKFFFVRVIDWLFIRLSLDL